MKKFFAGLLMGNAFHSLYQDILGKDSYLKVVDAGWVSAWITVPFAIIVAIVAINLYLSED